MPSESVQKKLERVRPPRVNISYEVETGGAIEMKELPFVMGVLGDFTGQPTEPLAKLKERKFVEVTPDNFDDVLAEHEAAPRVHASRTSSGKSRAPKLGVDLNFRSLDDFSPDTVARQVKPLRELLELRTKLADLRGALQTNDKLDEILQATLGDADKMKKLRAELGRGGRQQWLRRRLRAAGAAAHDRSRSSLLDQIVEQGRSGATTQTQERGKDLVKRVRRRGARRAR